MIEYLSYTLCRVFDGWRCSLGRAFLSCVACVAVKRNSGGGPQPY